MPPVLPQLRPSMRARISVLLLLSTLNTVLAAAAASVLFGVLESSPSEANAVLVRTVRARVDDIENRVLTAALAQEALADEVLGGIDLAQSSLEASELWTDEMRLDWQSWEESVRAVGGAPGLVPNRTDAALRRLRLSHERLLGRLLLSLDYARPEWVDFFAPFLPWFAAWLTLVAVATVVMARGLEVLLSRPMAALADAADRVGGGDLSQEIQVRASVPEVERVARAIGGMRDRLVRTIADIETRAAEMETILSNLSDGVLLLDREGRILELNRAAQRMLAPPERSRIVEGRLVTQGEAPPTEGALAERWLPELRTLEPSPEHELEVVRDYASGRRSFVISVSRVPLGRVVVVRDVTQERELEQLKRDFLSVITHELKTPLTPIEGYARLLQLGKGGPLTEKQQEFVGIIHAQAGNLKAMVQNLLDTTRIEGGNLPIHLQQVELRGFVQQVGTTWRGNTENKGIRFELDNLVPEGLAIQADPFRLEQVIGNLMSNAAKFTPAGGLIRLEAVATDQVVHLAVRDTGRGIPADVLGRVFDKFYQVEHGDKRAAGGAGLGLYIVRQLVEAMHGVVGVESEVGVGSRFQVSFPLRAGT